MPILNEGLDLASLPVDLRATFRGSIRKELFRSGTVLRKLVSTTRAPKTTSEFWCLERDWNAQRQLASSQGLSAGEVVRSRLAVRTTWQADLDRPVAGRLLRDVYGFIGAARWQPMNGDDDNVILMGGGTQVVIPNLTPRHIATMYLV